MALPQQLTTERLLLRGWTAADLPALHGLWSDATTLWWGAHVSMEQTLALFETLQAEGGWWAVEYQGDIVGNVFLRPSRYPPGTLELGDQFRSSWWGKGFATEAARALLATAPNRPVEAAIVPDNVRSKARRPKARRRQGGTAHAGRAPSRALAAEGRAERPRGGAPQPAWMMPADLAARARAAARWSIQMVNGLAMYTEE